MPCDRVERGRLACVRKRGDRLATSSPAALSSPGAPQGPRAFLFLRCPAGENGKRACLRSMDFRVRIPGGVPEFFCEGRAPSPALLQLGCGKDAPPRVQRADRSRGGAAGSRRLTVRTAALQAAYAGSSPAGNTNSSRCSAAGRRASFGTRRPQVRILPARPVDSPVAQRKARARGYEPRGRGFESLLGCQKCRAASRAADHSSRRRNSGEQSACLSSRKSRVQVPPVPPRRVAQPPEQLALTQQAAGSSPAAPTNSQRSVSSAGRAPALQAGGRWLEPITEYQIHASLAGLVTAPS
jgi:hypothetical protein